MNNEKDTLQAIKAEPYYRVYFKPTGFLPDRIVHLDTCRKLIMDSKVDLRGWDYPHYPTHNDKNQDIFNGQNYISAWVDWGDIREVWRFYQSFQFIHFFNIGIGYDESKAAINVQGITYTMTEIYEFLSRLIKQRTDIGDISVQISIHNVMDKKLIVSRERVPLFGDYVAKINDIVIVNKVYKTEEIIDTSKEIALEAILFVLSRFNWQSVPIETIKNDQNKLLERKI